MSHTPTLLLSSPPDVHLPLENGSKALYKPFAYWIIWIHMEHPQFFMGYGLQTTRLLVPNSGPNSSHLAEPPRLLLEAHGFLFIRQRHNRPRGGVVHDLFEVVFNSYGRSIWRCTYIYITYLKILYIYIHILNML